jgi:hypothetical protein
MSWQLEVHVLLCAICAGLGATALPDLLALLQQQLLLLLLLMLMLLMLMQSLPVVVLLPALVPVMFLLLLPAVWCRPTGHSATEWRTSQLLQGGVQRRQPAVRHAWLEPGPQPRPGRRHGWLLHGAVLRPLHGTVARA